MLDSYIIKQLTGYHKYTDISRPDPSDVARANFTDKIVLVAHRIFKNRHTGADLKDLVGVASSRARNFQLFHRPADFFHGRLTVVRVAKFDRVQLQLIHPVPRSVVMGFPAARQFVGMRGNDNAAFLMNRVDELSGWAFFCQAARKAENQKFTFGAVGGVKRVDFLSVDQEHAPFGGNVPKPPEFRIRPAHAVFGEGESGKPGACGLSDQILVFDKGTAGVSAGMNVKIKGNHHRATA